MLLLQEDYRKITVERKGEQNFFTSEMIKSCMKKVVAVNLHQTLQVCNWSFPLICLCSYILRRTEILRYGNVSSYLMAPPKCTVTFKILKLQLQLILAGFDWSSDHQQFNSDWKQLIINNDNINNHCHHHKGSPVSLHS